MNKQKSFIYQFDDEHIEQNYFVNKTNIYAFNGLIKNNSKLSFLYGPKKSGKTFLSKIWLTKNEGIELKNNLDFLINNKNNILIDDFLSFDEESVFYLVNNCILNNLKLLITSNIKINDIKFKFNDLSSRLKTFDKTTFKVRFKLNRRNQECKS